VRRWAFHLRSDWSLDELAREINPTIRGWVNYYGRYHGSALAPALGHITDRLAWWAFRKFKSLKRSRERAYRWLERVHLRQPALFAHWPIDRAPGRTMGAV
jgi:RNA-directed DNA polymerase